MGYRDFEEEPKRKKRRREGEPLDLPRVWIWRTEEGRFDTAVSDIKTRKDARLMGTHETQDHAARRCWPT